MTPLAQDSHVIRNYVRHPEVFVAGAGATLRDENGNEWLDLLGGIAVSALGHGHAGLTTALQDQVASLLHVSNLYRHPHTEAVATAIAEATGLAATYFCNSGAEAIEAALKLARRFQHDAGRTGQTGFLAVEGGFHGRTFGALSITHHPRYREPFEPLVPGARFIPRDDIPALEAAFAAQAPAAFVAEPIQGEAGIVELAPEFLKRAQELCQQHSALFVADEIQTGCGRTGTFLYSQQLGLAPDVVTLAKPLAGGVPMGAMLVRQGLEGVLVPGDHGSTFAGGPLACRAALVLLHELAEGLQEHVKTVGDSLRSGLQELARSHAKLVAGVRGRGLMLALHIPQHAPTVQAALHNRRVIANCAGGNTVRFLPPYVLTLDQAQHALNTLDTVLHEIQP